jgi:hypothetical protein
MELDFEDEDETGMELDFEDEVEALMELDFEDEDETCMELDFEDEVELFVELELELEVDETGHVPEADPTNMTSVYPPSVQNPTNEASLPATLGAKVKGMVIVAPGAIC